MKRSFGKLLPASLAALVLAFTALVAEAEFKDPLRRRPCEPSG